MLFNSVAQTHQGDGTGAYAMQVLRLSQLATTPGKPGLLPISPATVWRLVKAGKFPAPFKLSPATTVWDADEIAQFIEQQRRGGGK